MLDVILNFGTFLNLAIFLALFAGQSAWAYYCLKRGKQVSLAPAIILSVALLVLWSRLAAVDVDEVEHLHCAWMVHSGLVPFKDFWQHHPPLLWIMIAPFFVALKPSAFILELSRIFSAFLFTVIACIGWKISRKVWHQQARLSMYVLVLFGSSILGEFLCLRPDLCMSIFLLLGIYFCLEISERKISPVFFAGASFALAASFMCKQYLLFFLPLFIIVRQGRGLRARRVCAYLLGFFSGSLPLLYYLAEKKIVREFFFWVFSYNRQRIVFSVIFPAAVCFLGVWGAYLLWRRYRDLKDAGAFVLCAAFCLVTLSSLTHTLLFFFSCNLTFWFVLCAITGSGVALPALMQRLPSLRQRSLAMGLLLSLIVSTNVVSVAWHKVGYFGDAKKAIAQLIAYCGGDSCLVILPYHPIFAADATRLYSYWQFDLTDTFPQIRDDIKRKPIAEQVVSLRPAVVMFSFDKKNFLSELFLRRLISKDGYKKLRLFLDEHYTIRYLGEYGYYVRKDRL